MEINNSIINNFCERNIDYIESLIKLKTMEQNLNCVDGKIIGTGRPDYTITSTTYSLNIKDKNFALIDVPGIEGDEKKFEETIKKSLEKAHSIFYVNGSGKKIEEATLGKIKRYMHDGTSVYAIFNVHCKGKLNRIEGIDKTYLEELKEAYKKQNEIVEQTEKELISFLGMNYKGSISVNGLLSFCSNAIDFQTGYTTIVLEEDKNLRKSQQIFLNDYNNDFLKMRKQSNISEITDIIIEKIENYDELIYEENIKKLKKRLKDITEKIEFLKKEENIKIKNFCNIYDSFETNCFDAKEDFIHTINHIGRNSVEEEFENIKADLFSMIEKNKDKTKDWEFKQYFDERKDIIKSNIEDGINKKFSEAQSEYSESIKDAQERLLKDFERTITNFEISIQGNKLELDTSFTKNFQYTAKDFGKHAFTTGSLVASFALAGLPLGGMGAAIGAAIGLILGVLSSIWNFFASENKRISHAKSKIAQSLNDQIYEISSEIKQVISKLNIEDKINDSYEEISRKVSQQKKSLNDVKIILETVSKELVKKNKAI
jgi:hypothetical protein